MLSQKLSFYLFIVAFFLPVCACTQTKQNTFEAFAEEAASIQKALRVPGIAIGIMENSQLVWQTALGYADLGTKEAMHTKHLTPLASISKTMAAILILQLEEQAKLNTDDPVAKYIKNTGLPNSTKISHLLSHTSEGIPQSFFEYSSRYGILQSIIENVAQKDYVTLMNEQILNPLAMNQSIPGVGAKGYEMLAKQIASPHKIGQNGTIVKGNLPAAGLKTSTGMVSSIGDLAKYAAAIYEGKLISPASMKKMWTNMRSSEGDTLPYGLGWFVNKVEEVDIFWHYGHEDCYSTVLMYVPSKNLTLIVLANSATLSEHGRMLSGNPARSALFWAFLKHFVFNQNTEKVLAWDSPLEDWKRYLAGSLSQVQRMTARETLISRLMLESFMSSYVPSYEAQSQATANLLLDYYSEELANTADPQLLATLLKIIKAGNYLAISVAQKITENSLLKDKSPYMHYLAGDFHYTFKEYEKALPHFKRVADLGNFNFRGYQALATYYTGEILKSQRSPLASQYLQRVIAWGWNLDNIVNLARQKLAE